MKNILVTGASGFIGRRLCKTLFDLNIPVIGTFRDTQSSSKLSLNIKRTNGDIRYDDNWIEILKGKDCVIHCAGRAHVIKKSAKKNELDIYRTINVEGTKKLAKKCAEVGVKRFIFLSSIGVHGTFTDLNKPFSICDKPNPLDDYAISKLEAEKELLDISAKTGLEIVILRFPLVYGNGMKGNFARLLKLIRFGIPLPFKNIHNKKTFISIENLIDLIIRCIDHPKAAGNIFLASDKESLLFSDFLYLLAKSINRSVFLFPIPIKLLKLLGLIFGKKKEINQLINSLEVDSSHTYEILNWSPPLSVYEGIKNMANDK